MSYCYDHFTYFSLQVIDEDIMSDGFNVTCQLRNASLCCSAAVITATQMIISLPLNVVMEGQVITFNVGYSYEMCVNDVLQTTIIGVYLI